MNIFSKIKDAIFGHKSAPKAAPAPQPTGAGAAPGQPRPEAPAQAQTQAQAQPVDVERVLTQIAGEKGNPDLNYRSSIVDLMKLLKLDSSLGSRKELAKELGYTGDMNDSATMNVWLHKQVMTKLAENGGKVPDNLTD